MRQWLFDYVRDRFSAEPDYPWGDDPQAAVLRHFENAKWYGLVMAIPRGKLGLPGDGTIDILNVKCDPNLIGSLREQPGFFPAYHMNKERWLTVALDGTVDPEQIITLLHMSYDLTMPLKPKR